MYIFQHFNSHRTTETDPKRVGERNIGLFVHFFGLFVLISTMSKTWFIWCRVSTGVERCTVCACVVCVPVQIQIEVYYFSFSVYGKWNRWLSKTTNRYLMAHYTTSHPIYTTIQQSNRLHSVDENLHFPLCYRTDYVFCHGNMKQKVWLGMNANCYEKLPFRRYTKSVWCGPHTEFSQYSMEISTTVLKCDNVHVEPVCFSINMCCIYEYSSVVLHTIAT